MAQNTPMAYRKIGPVYIVNYAGQPASVISVAEYKNSTDNSWHYFLKLNSLKDNIELKRKEIIVKHEKPLEFEQIIGRLGDIFFMLADSLVGYDVHTLEPVLTESSIAASNPLIRLSKHPNSYLLDDAAKVMYITDDNGAGHKLYPGSQILKPDDSNNEQAPENYSYEFAAEYKLYDRYNTKYAYTCVDTSDNNLYILGSEKETGSVLSYFGTSIYPDREENRKLTILPYNEGGKRPDDKTPKYKTGKESYFKGGFLHAKFYIRAWKNSNNDRIILFQTNTIKPMLCVALVDKDGNEKWRTAALAEANTFMDYLIEDNHLLLWFNYPDGRSGFFKTNLFNVELEKGRLVK
nr:hypothetical protein [uncultured bacterium]